MTMIYRGRMPSAEQFCVAQIDRLSRIMEYKLIKIERIWHILNEDNRTPDKRNAVPMMWLRCLHWLFALIAVLTTSTTQYARLAATIVASWLSKKQRRLNCGAVVAGGIPMMSLPTERIYV